MSKYLSDIIGKGESLHLDFKYEISDARKIARTLVAFSNTEGGKLLIGVKDNGRIAGIRTEEEYFMLESASSLYCKPQVNYSAKKWIIDRKTVLEVDIPPANTRPYLAMNHDGRWLAYIRVNDQNIRVNSIQIRVWKNEKKKKGVFLEYTDKEKILLDYLEKNKEISLPGFCRLAAISYRKASDIMVKLVSLKLIDIVYSDKSIVYKLNSL
jgi:predicted HTH transcriptional regulator